MIWGARPDLWDCERNLSYKTVSALAGERAFKSSIGVAFSGAASALEYGARWRQDRPGDGQAWQRRSPCLHLASRPSRARNPLFLPCSFGRGRRCQNIDQLLRFFRHGDALAVDDLLGAHLLSIEIFVGIAIRAQRGAG
jgi:hypothetical protein